VPGTNQYTQSLNTHFKDISTKLLRDTAIHQALADGYTQAQIARYLDISRARVSQMVKNSEGMVNI
jgi:DNA-binding transcriptional regulator LsrR (DeoR family)